MPIIALMREILRQILIGSGSVFLAPWGSLPAPEVRITLPPETAAQAVGRDFSNVSSDFKKAINAIENERQLELKLKCGRNT